MNVSAFDLFKIGIGPSSSHTVGPMIAASASPRAWRGRRAGRRARRAGRAVRLLGATGKGHGTDKAVMLGLEGCLPDRIDPDEVEPRLARIRQGLCLSLAGTHVIDFQEMAHLFYFRRLLGAVQAGAHSNGMRFLAVDGQGGPLAEGIYYSIGGGFVVDGQGGKGDDAVAPAGLPHPFRTGADLLGACRASGLSIAQVVLRNECARRTPSAVRAGLLDIWSAERLRRARLPHGGRAARPLASSAARPSCVASCGPGPRNAARSARHAGLVNLYAMAVNEENAAGGASPRRPTARPA